MKLMYCNKCGKELKIQNGIAYEDFIHIRKEWGYFSKRDGRTQEFVLCEECVEQMETEFIFPSKWYETTEML